LQITQVFQAGFTVLALLADGDVLFILSLAFWTVDVTHSVYFPANYVKIINCEKLLPVSFKLTIYTTIYGFLSMNLYYI
jgi:hypothetical protein